MLFDADAWILAKAMQDDTSGLSLSNAMRTVYQEDGNVRIERFYNERFGGNADNVSAAYVPLMVGIDVGPITNFPLSIELLKSAAGAGYGYSSSDFPCLRMHRRIRVREHTPHSWQTRTGSS